MKALALLILGTMIIIPNILKSQNMNEQYINTSIGKIAIQTKEVEGSVPIIFLHGIYYDHNLWNYQISRISDRTVISIDMPLHGNSKNITKENWTLDDCATMLIEVFDSLEITKVIAIGHSWGSMTILRAASKYPDRFLSVGFCNMPFKAATEKTKKQFKMQHLILLFRSFYTKQVAKAMYGKQNLKENPNLLDHLELSMGKLTNKEVKQIDKNVIINVDDTEHLILQVKNFSYALMGNQDHVSNSKIIETILVEGGHISPLEAPEEVFKFVTKVIGN